MIVNTAISIEEIEKLIQESNKKIAKKRRKLDVLLLNRSTLLMERKKLCQHPLEKLDIETTYEEDEFGRHRDSWTKYIYTCKCCYTKITCSKQHTTLEAIQNEMRMYDGKISL